MNTFNRNGNRWTVNELLSLQREYELLEWTIQQIAVKHQRTEAAILFKLESEGFITSWNNARGFDMNSYKGTFEDDNVSENYVSNEEYEDCDNESEYSQDDDVTFDGVTSDGVTFDGVTSDGVTSDGVTFDGVTSDGVTSNGVTSDVEKLSERIWSLETQVTDIKEVVQQYFNSMISSNNKKRKPLRKQNAQK